MTEQEWLTSTDPAAMLQCLQQWHTDGHSPWTQTTFERKLRLFAVACCRQLEVWDGAKCDWCGGDGVGKTWADDRDECYGCHGNGRIGGLTDPRSRRAVEVAERYADGAATAEEMDVAAKAVAGPPYNEPWNRGLALWCGAPQAMMAAEAMIRHKPIPPTVQAALLRCIFGNPFRPVVLPKDSQALRIVRVKLAALDFEYERDERNNDKYAEYAKLRNEEREALAKASCPWITATVQAVAQSIYDERRWQDMPILADALEEAGCTDAAILMHLRGWEACPCLYGYPPPPSRPQCSDGWVRPRCSECGGKRVIVDADPHGPEVDRYRCPACRGTGFAPAVHARGCHVVDAILGKE